MKSVWNKKSDSFAGRHSIFIKLAAILIVVGLVPLLVIGGIGTLLTGVVTPNGVASLVCGVAAPILFIVGGIQQNKAYNEAHTPTP